MSYTAKVLAALALAAALILLWQLKQVLLLVFGGVIVAVVVDAAARRLAGAAHVPQRLAVTATVVSGLALLALLAWWMGGVVAEQVQAVREGLPVAAQAARDWLGQMPLGRQVLDVWAEVSEDAVQWSRVAKAAGLTATLLAHLLLILMLGIFMAVEPRLYRQGLVRLLPPRHRERADEVLDASGGALRGWLKGQAISMAFVGVATGIGLALLGVPAALMLGVLAGLLDFVPFFGPVVAGVLAVMFGFIEGPQVALYVALLMLVIQQVESNLVLPLVQRWTVQLPPALAVVSVVAFGALFGVAGVVFATPLMVVLVAMVRTGWVEGVLERRPPAR